jgi:branched-chain amino acid transport system ATP-binding protein
LALSEPALELDGVRASYGARTVLEGFSLSLAPGEIVALLGHNGAGKTTALRVAAGLKAPSAGKVRMLGRDVGRLNASARARSGLALVPEGVRGIFPTLTVRQNLETARPASSEHGNELDELLEEAFGDVLVARANQVAGSMSGGQRQMLAISIALRRHPSVLLLDEPSTGLAPVIVDRIFGVVGELPARTGTSVLVVEQDVSAALRIATRVQVIQTGRLVAEFSREECPPPTELWRYF